MNSLPVKPAPNINLLQIKAQTHQSNKRLANQEKSQNVTNLKTNIVFGNLETNTN